MRTPSSRGAPIRGLVPHTRDRHPRAYATWLTECRPLQGLQGISTARVTQGYTLGYSLTPLGGLKFRIVAEPTRTRDVNPEFREN